MKKALIIIVTCLWMTACSTQQPIHNVSETIIPPKSDGSLHSKEEVAAAIIEAAKYKRWKPVQIDDDTIEASISVRSRHHATVQIDYSELSYSINLLESEGLDESNGKIHRNYNKWIILLDEQIQARLAGT